MKKFLMLAFIMNFCVLKGTSQIISDSMCNNAVSQLEMSRCLDKKYNLRKKQLDRTYSKVFELLKRDSDTKLLELFKQSQDAWSKSKFKMSHLYQLMFENGSMMHVVQMEYENESINNRIRELNRLLEDLSR